MSHRQGLKATPSDISWLLSLCNAYTCGLTHGYKLISYFGLFWWWCLFPAICYDLYSSIDNPIDDPEGEMPRNFESIYVVCWAMVKWAPRNPPLFTFEWIHHWLDLRRVWTRSRCVYGSLSDGCSHLYDLTQYVNGKSQYHCSLPTNELIEASQSPALRFWYFYFSHTLGSLLSAFNRYSIISRH